MVERREGNDAKKRAGYLKPGDLADLIKEMRDSLLKSTDGEISSPFPAKATENTDRIVDGLIRNAEIDFKDSNLLYKNGSYSNAVYHLQQAIEKLVKACALFFFPLNYSSIRKTSHNSPEIYLKLLTDPRLNKLLRKVGNLIPEIDLKPLDKLDQTIKNIKRTETKVELAKMPATVLNNILDVCDKIMAIDVKSKGPDVLKEQYGNSFDHYLKEALTLLTPNNPDLESQISGLNLKKLVEGNTNFIYDWLNEFITTIIPLYLLGLIVYPHESFTRYPGELMNPQDYNENFGIVQVFPRIWNLGNNILMKLNS